MSSFAEWLKSVGLAGYAQSQAYGGNAGKHGYGPAGHGGVDIAAPTGTPLRVPAGVTRITAGQERDKNGNLSGWGNFLRLFYADGSYSQFSHLSDFLGIKPGQTISNPLPGSVYARSGNSGNSTGPHVDIERRTAGGQRVNPATANYPGARLLAGVPGVSLPVLTGGVKLPGLTDPSPQVLPGGTPTSVWDKLKALGVDFSKWSDSTKKSFEEEYDPTTGKFKGLPLNYEFLKPDALKAFTGIDTSEAGWETSEAGAKYGNAGLAGQVQEWLAKAGINVLGVVIALVLFLAGVYLLGTSF